MKEKQIYKLQQLKMIMKLIRFSNHSSEVVIKLIKIKVTLILLFCKILQTFRIFLAKIFLRATSKIIKMLKILEKSNQ